MNYHEKFTEDGFLHLKGTVSNTINGLISDTQERVTECLDRLKAQGKIRDTKPNAPFETRLYEAGAEHVQGLGRAGFGREAFHTKPLFNLYTDPHLVSVLRTLMGEHITALPAFNLRPKLPDQDTTNTPWHQDAGYFPDATHCDVFTCWIPLVNATHEMGCLQVIRGSHKWPLHKHFQGNNAGKFLEVDEFEYAVDDLITVEMEVGDVLLFNQNTMHRSTSNNSQHIRWNIDLRFGISGQYTGNNRQILWGDNLEEWRITGDNVTSFEAWQRMAQAPQCV